MKLGFFLSLGMPTSHTDLVEIQCPFSFPFSVANDILSAIDLNEGGVHSTNSFAHGFELF